MFASHTKVPKKWTFLFPVLLLFGLLPVAFASQDKNSAPNQSAADTNTPPEQNQALRPEHKHPAFNQRSEERNRMVAKQIQARGVRDPNVLRALRTVPRHAFVRSQDSRWAYDDHPLSIGLEQTISQPYIVAYMTEALKLDSNDKVLEIGTGSGYQAAVCAEIVREVYTIEIIEKLAETAKERLKELGYRNVFVKAGDGYLGWQENATYDAVILS